VYAEEQFKPVSVTFHEPWSATLATATMGVFVTLVLSVATAGSLWGLVGYLNWPQGPPAWFHAISGTVTAAVLLALVATFWIWLRRRLVLRENDVEIGGLALRTTIPYEQLRIIRMAQPSKSMFRRRQIVLERREGRSRFITLSLADANECFETLRTLAPHLVAFDEFGQSKMPLDDAYRDQAHEVFHLELKRIAREQLVRAIAGVALLPLFVWMLLTFKSGSHVNAKLWLLVIALPIGSAVYLVKYFRTRKQLQGAANRPHLKSL
jgi:hypothetical protein